MTGGAGVIFWIILAVIFFIIEGSTVQLVCIWFAFGSLFAMLASFIGAPVWAQLLIFLVSSIAVLIVGRPILTEKITPRKTRTNVDRLIGQVAVVTETVDNIEASGRVSANGLDWTARSETGEVIPAESKVLIKQIDGVKLIVERLEEGNG